MLKTDPIQSSAAGERIARAFRGTPLWSWNEELDPEECRRQVREFARAGYGGAYMHARLGLLTPYLGEQFLECVRASADEAARCGLAMHLYDEDRWPSGWASGKVPLADPAFRLKSLVRRSGAEPPPGDDRRIAVSGTGHAFDVHTMELGNIKFNGTCYVDLMSPAPVQAFIAATHERYLKEFPEAMGAEFPSMFSDEPALTYLYTGPEGALPWTDALPGLFKERTGRPLLEQLEALFEDRPESGFVRTHYYRLCTELFASSFMRPIHSWCETHGIPWTGHFMYEHSLALHFSWGVNSHPSYRHFDWPGIDHLGRQVGEVVTGLGCRSAVHQFGKPRMMTELFGCGGQHLGFADRRWIAAQQLVLGANHLVPHLSAYTLAGPRKRDYPPTLSSQQPWWPLNEHLEHGLAQLSELMARGHGRPEVLLIHPQESTYVLSKGPLPLARGKSWVERFFYPCDVPELAALDRTWKGLCHRLLDLGYQFDFGDEQILAEVGRVEPGAASGPFVVGEARYRAVIVPPLVTMRDSTLKLLMTFMQSGGVVLCLGDALRMIDGEDGAETEVKLREFKAAASCVCVDLDALCEELRRRVAPQVGILAGDGTPTRRVWCYTRDLEAGSLTLVANLDRLQTREVRVRIMPRPYERVVHAWDGHTPQAIGLEVSTEGIVELTLEAGALRLLVSGDVGEVPFSRNAVLVASTRVIPARDLAWTCERLDENALTLDQARFRTGASDAWSERHPLLAIKEALDARQYTGPVELEFEFEAKLEPEAARALQVVSEYVNASYRLNGNALSASSGEGPCWRDVRWRPFAIGDELKRGRNVLQIAIPEFQPANPHHTATPAQRIGTTLESIMLLGEFSIDGVAAEGPQNWEGQIEPHTETALAVWLPPVRLHYLNAPFRMSGARPLAAGDVVPQGLAFYCGRLRYQTELHHDDVEAGAILLELERLTAPVAEVLVNGVSVGIYGWAPLQVNLAPHLTQGVNRLEIILYHSLRNLLGPHHHPEGEPIFVNPESFRPEGFSGWLAAREQQLPIPRWREPYCFVEFGLFSETPGSTTQVKECTA